MSKVWASKQRFFFKPCKNTASISHANICESTNCSINLHFFFKRVTALFSFVARAFLGKAAMQIAKVLPMDKRAAL